MFQMVLDKLISREKKITIKKRDAEILAELRKPQEDSELANQKDLPELQRLPGLKLTGQALSDLLMVFEFLHNFGETLGFGEFYCSYQKVKKIKINFVIDMDSLPTLQSLHQALCSDGTATDAEDELISVMTHLLVCAIEDPGIPNPNRHTTLLGQSLRTADITNSNISEILRIYLYAVATGEVRQTSGLTFDRDRERRVADHHSTEQFDISTSKNQQYYEQLHENTTWKLSECLKENPFVSLNSTVKAQILAHLCNDLLLNKAVSKQIEGSLESMAQYKREKYLLDNRIRKYKHLHTRKIRMEQFEKQQLLAKQSESIPKDGFVEPTRQGPAGDNLVNENNNETPDKLNESVSNSNLIRTASSLTNASSIDNLTDVSDLANHKDDSLHSTDVAMAKNGDELSPVKSVDDIKVNKSLDDFSMIDTPRSLNNGTSTPDMTSLLNKKIISRELNDVSSTTDLNLDEELSDLESEGTILEEDEDNRMTADEVLKKLEKIIKAGQQNKMLLEQSCNQLRATCYGQDRFWRRYWYLPKAGGIFVEGLESAQPDILKYHSLDDEVLSTSSHSVSAPVGESTEKKKRGRKRKHQADEEESCSKGVIEDNQRVNNEVKPTNEVKPVTELKPGDEVKATNDMKPTSDMHQNDDGMMDIEDSIPRAILVQKACTIDDVEMNNKISGVSSASVDHITNSQTATNLTSNPICNHEEGSNSGASSDVVVIAEDTKLENGAVKEEPVTETEEINPNTLVTGAEVAVKQEIKDEIKNEADDDMEGVVKSETLMDKWFSIANRELQLTSTECTPTMISQASFSNVTCDNPIQCQGNRWEIGNNAQYFNVPVEGLNSTLVFNRDSFLTLSGLDEDMMSQSMNSTWKSKDDSHQDVTMTEDEITSKSTINKIDVKQEELPAPFHLPSFINMSLGNISAYIQCDNPSPLQMTPDEQKLLEEVKLHGLPKRLERNLVPKDLRYGWWKIDDIEIVKELIQCLHVRGVRERELRQHLLTALSDNMDLTTLCHVAHARAPPPSKGYIDPEPMNAWNPQIARRVELSLLDQVETLEDKIASASMQMKGWQVPNKDDVENGMDMIGGISLIRERILGLEAAIERRYLKPPLGTR